ncbi:MAG: S8 family serine peptidase [Acidobacteria bacterium]|nr:S8 family serine peptidase [Acidobacteriota bacterium]
MKSLFIGLVALGSAAIAWSGQPAALRSVDPLLTSPPSVEIRWSPDTRDPAEKMTPLLHRRLAQVDESGELKVLVTLVTPADATAMRGGTGRNDEAEAARMSVLEHQFVDAAVPLGFRAIHGLRHIPVVVGRIPAGAVRELAALPIVRAVEPDFKLRAMRTEGAALMHSDTLLAQGGDGNGIGVAILDSGIDWTHPELPAGTKVVVHADYTGTQTGDTTGFDDQGHGTAVAGIIGGLQGGMAPKATLWALKVLDSKGSGDFSNSVRALDDVYANRDQFGGVRVVNMSLGGGGPFNNQCDGQMPAMDAALAKVVNAGIAVFISSGNEGCTNGISFPACISDAIAVGAVYDAAMGSAAFGEGGCTPGGCTDQSTAADMITCYSSSGAPLDILAPSHCATTTKLGGGYESCFGGTSAASPYAAGVAAQLLSLRPQTTVAQLKTALTSTGRPITDTRNGITRPRIDAVQASQYLAGGGGGGGGTTTLWIPVIAHATGTNGTNWASDVAVLNGGASSTPVRFALYIGGQKLTGASQSPLAPGQMAVFYDLVGQFGVSGGGALEIGADQPIVVTSRTYNTVGGKTYGQFLDAYSAADGLSTGQLAVLNQLQESTAFRTNIGVVNLGTAPATVTITLYDASGSSVGAFNVSLSPGQWKQDQQPFLKRFGRTSTTGYATVSVTSGSGIVAYASVIDNGSGDPTTIPMKR